MCGPKVQDNSDKVAAIEAERARQEREAAERERLRKEQEFGTSLDSSYRAAIEEAKRYFSDQGLDPEQYSSAITSAAQSKRGAVPKLDTNPGSYFEGLGGTVYGQQTDARRNKAMRDLNSFARDGFTRDRIADTADDSFINSTVEEQFLEAMARLEGQKARGSLNDYGLSKALSDLTRQKTRASDELQGIGQAVLEKGRTGLSNIANTGKSAISSLGLGDEFDPFKYSTDIDNEATNFFASLGDRIKSSAPTDLFDVGAAYQRGGQSQGVRNSPYDREASTGFFDFLDETEEEKKKKQPQSAF
jgi:hypothetical protein